MTPRRPASGAAACGSVPRLTPPLRGQPFQAGRGVFACVGLAPEQLVCLGQRQRVRAAELPDLVLDWQFGGADLVLDVLAAGVGERPLQRALAAVGEELAECAAQFAAAAAGPGDRPVVIGPGRAFGDRGELSMRPTTTDDAPTAAASSARPDPTIPSPTSPPRNRSSAGPSSATSSTNTNELHRSPDQDRWLSSGTPQVTRRQHDPGYRNFEELHINQKLRSLRRLYCLHWSRTLLSYPAKRKCR